MKVVICASEVVPFAKTGGLADVSGALPLALEELGIKVIITLPKYKAVKAVLSTQKKFKVEKLNNQISFTKIGKDIPVYFIENDKMFDRDGLYGEKTGDYPDNLERFAFYSKKTLDLLKNINFKADIIHCNDWQSSLIPVYLKNLNGYRNDKFYKEMKVVLTIHNLGYQGLFNKEKFPGLGLDRDLFNMDALEFYDKINVLKGGIAFSDIITTVSPTYAKEIQTKEFGCGLEGLLTKKTDLLFGVLNGLDYNLWDPGKDDFIFKKYSLESLEDKYVNKELLQRECKLTTDSSIPLFGLVGRLAEQKGLDILSAAINEITKLRLQMVILGTGDLKYHKVLEEIAKIYSKSISVNLKFDDCLAHKIYAGSDFFLMPSKYEPCGLGQMISMKYGTIPIVYKTGGLADTVVDFDPLENSGNGFVFDCYNKDSLFKTIKMAIYFYKDKKLFSDLIKRAAACNFSWEESAKQYIQLYKKSLE